MGRQGYECRVQLTEDAVETREIRIMDFADSVLEHVGGWSTQIRSFWFLLP